jgi:hypothetical protein
MKFENLSTQKNTKRGKINNKIYKMIIFELLKEKITSHYLEDFIHALYDTNKNIILIINYFKLKKHETK